jgi:hypothetical protein
MNKQCANCDATSIIESDYCFQCGQKFSAMNRPFGQVLAESMHESLDIDGRLVLTLKTLFFHPGKLTYEYNNGKRVKYTPPLRMYLVLSIIFFLVLSQFDLSGGRSRASLDDIYNYVPKMMFIMLPVFALFLQVLFRSTYYLSNLIFTLHLHCFGYVLMAILLPIETIENRHIGLQVIQAPIIGYLIFYITKAIKETYGESWLKTILKSTVLIFSYIAVIAISIEFIVNWIT